MLAQVLSDLVVRFAGNADIELWLCTVVDLIHYAAIVDSRAVDRCYVKIIAWESEIVLVKPSSRRPTRLFARHYPKNIIMSLGEKFIAETMKIFQAGDTCQLPAAEEAPQQNHCTAVRNDDIRV